jgi:hypothetical protein
LFPERSPKTRAEQVSRNETWLSLLIPLTYLFSFDYKEIPILGRTKPKFPS